MNKITKGALAVAAATALALGGAGSLAYWQAQQQTSAATFTAGTVSLSAGSGVWKRGDTTLTVSSVRLIPGDVLTYTQTFAASVVGDGILVTAAASTPTINAPVEMMLPNPLTVSAPQLSGSNVEAIAGTSFWKVTGDGTITVTYTLTVPQALDSGKNGVVNLGPSTVTLKQVSALPTSVL